MVIIHSMAFGAGGVDDDYDVEVGDVDVQVGDEVSVNVCGGDVVRGYVGYG